MLNTDKSTLSLLAYASRFGGVSPVATAVIVIVIAVVLVLIVVFGLQFVGQKSTTLVRSIPSISITFDNNTYEPNTAARITVIDPSANTNNTMQTIFVQVYSDSDAAGIHVRLDENGTNSSQFVTHPYLVKLTPLGSDNSISALQVHEGDTIYANYIGHATTASIGKTRQLPNPSDEKPQTGGVNITGTGQLTNTFSDYTAGLLTTGTSISSAPIPVYGCFNDHDQDGICDEWENPAVFTGLQIGNPYSGVTYQLTCSTSITDDCPDSNLKDIYVQASYMQSPGNINQAPSSAAISDLQKIFRAHGIRLHFLLDPQSIGYYTDHTSVPGTVSDSPGTDSFYGLKNAYFGTPAERTCPATLPPNTTCAMYLHDLLTEKSQVFHYGLFIHAQADKPSSSGWAEIFGNDFAVSMGAFDGGVGSENQTAGTIMHELGHNLNLNHGGPPSDSRNCKPNYLSVMSYTRQFPYFVPNWSLDYSTVKYDLNEGAIIEGKGIGNTNPNVTAYSYRDASGWHITTGPAVAGRTGIDWDGTDRTFLLTTALPQPYPEIQNLGIPECNTISTDSLSGYNDWNNINLRFQNSPNFANGAALTSNPEREMTRDDVDKLFLREYNINSTGKNLEKLFKDMPNQPHTNTNYGNVYPNTHHGNMALDR